MPNPPLATQRAKHQQVWRDEMSLATTLLVLFADTYGLEACEEWEPVTISLEISDDFGVELPQANFDRLMTAIQLLTTDAFFVSLPDFIQFCNILSGDIYDPGQWDPADAAEIAWGITEALLISPPDGDDPFSDEILAYIGAALDAEGIINPPDILRVALRNGNPGDRVRQDFADDPEMFAAVYAFEESKTNGINAGVREGLRLLSQQLSELPLRRGNTAEITRRLFEKQK